MTDQKLMFWINILFILALSVPSVEIKILALVAWILTLIYLIRHTEHRFLKYFFGFMILVPLVVCCYIIFLIMFSSHE